MKKSVLLLAGLMAVALAGSAQAAPATMFAVQNAGGVDQFTVNDAGQINKLDVTGAAAIGLANVPGSVPLTAGVGALHVGTKGNTFTTASTTFQHVAYPIAFGGATYAGPNAANFSFYRINQNDSTLAYSLPAANASLGYLNFGIVDWTLDPTTAAYRKNLAQIWAFAEGPTATNPNAWTTITNTPSFITFNTTHWTGAAQTRTEKLRITSDGKLGIGTAAPTSIISIDLTKLPAYTTNALAVAGGLSAGAFYRTGADPDVVCVVH